MTPNTDDVAGLVERLRNKSFMQLIARSPDIGDGWRQVSKTLWPLVESFKSAELIETASATHRVRFSEAGLHVARYLL
jgi:hypothetical protein